MDRLLVFYVTALGLSAAAFGPQPQARDRGTAWTAEGEGGVAAGEAEAAVPVE